jgi:tetratricopeptide (TPR) repeat protein
MSEVAGAAQAAGTERNQYAKLAKQFAPRIPATSLSQSISDALGKPSCKSLVNVGDELLAADQTDIAAELFRGMASLPKAELAPFVRLAQIADKRGEPWERIAAWQACFRLFPDKAYPVWYFSLATALRVAGRLDEEKEVIESLSRRFPEHAGSLAFQAKGAAHRQEWSRACDLWLQCLRQSGDSAVPAWRNGLAKALLGDWRTQEAVTVWRETLKRHPAYEPAYTEFAKALMDMGRWTEAKEIWDELIRTSSIEDNAFWQFSRARCFVNDPGNNSALDVIDELQTRFPDSSYGWDLAIEVANTRHWGLEATMKVFDDALARFPGERRIVGQYVRVLLGYGRFDEAERLVEWLEASGQDPEALVSRWRLLMDREGTDRIREAVVQTLTTQIWDPPVCNMFLGFLESLKLPWSFDLALRFCEDVLQRNPRHLALHCVRAGLLIRLGRDREAAEVIEALPPLYETTSVLELRAWAAAYRGNKSDEESTRQRILRVRYNAAIHAPEPNLERVAVAGAVSPGERVVLFMMIRDELGNLPDFFRHHRQLGICHFVIVDNMSTDGSAEWLAAQPDVTLYRTADNFPAASSGMRWINALIETHGRGRWCIYIDADELFTYPGWESVPVADLVGYLENSGAQAMSGYMLDVFPERLIDADGRRARHDDCKYYDDNYVWVGLTYPPYRTPIGGVRCRVFSTYETLHKIPLIKGDEVRYLGSHQATASRYSDVTSVLLHYKCIDLVGKAGRYFAANSTPKSLVDRHPDSMRRYERYASHLKDIASIDLRNDATTRVLADSMTLADRGLMTAPEDYLRWLGARGSLRA